MDKQNTTPVLTTSHSPTSTTRPPLSWLSTACAQSSTALTIRPCKRRAKRLLLSTASYTSDCCMVNFIIRSHSRMRSHSHSHGRSRSRSICRTTRTTTTIGHISILAMSLSRRMRTNYVEFFVFFVILYLFFFLCRYGVFFSFFCWSGLRAFKIRRRLAIEGDTAWTHLKGV